jgi:deazaflavin-dependent oxidoreductase (nitroreductase family)
MPTVRDRVNKAYSAVHTRVYRRSGGRLGKRLGKAPMLLLTTRGRRSGQPRTKPLMYLADGERWVLVASNAGQDHHPAWYLNLLDQPLAEIRVADQDIPVNARHATDEERAELWPKLVGIFSGYARYAKKTDRPIPVLVLTRR